MPQGAIAADPSSSAGTGGQKKFWKIQSGRVALGMMAAKPSITPP
jgi:hypothetical protein